MANLKSSKKDILRNKRNRERNRYYKSTLKTVIKLAKESIESQSDTKDQVVKLAMQQLHKTVSKGIMHKNAAARKKSRLAKALAKAGQ